MRGGGGGGGWSYEVGYWVYPLPPSGAMTVAVEWPSQELGLTTRTIDGGEIAAAGARSELLWDDDRAVVAARSPTPGVDPGGGFSISRTTVVRPGDGSSS